MPESTIRLPIEIEKQAKAIDELKKVQKALADVGRESTSVNAAISKASKKMASDMGDAFTGMKKKGEDWKKSLTPARDGLELLTKGIQGLKKAIELAEFSQEFKRLERAIPVDRMRELQKEATGTTSKFELMQKAAKELGIGATEGMDETAKSLQNVLGQWNHFFEQAKVAVGGLIGDAILWLDRLSNKLAGIGGPRGVNQAELDANPRLNIALNARKAADDKWKAMMGMSGTKGQEAFLDQYGRATAEWHAFYNAGVDEFNRFGGDQESYAEPPNNKWGDYLSKMGRGITYGSKGAGKKAGAKSPEWKDKNWAQNAEGYIDDYFSGAQAGAGSSLWSTNFGGSAADDFLTGTADVGTKEMGALGMDWLSSLEGAGEKLKKYQEETEQYTSAINTAFDAMSSGVAAAVDAAVNGSESILKAFAKATSNELKAVALKNGILAIQEKALAFAAAARYDYRSAGEHNAAASQHALAAVAAGAGAMAAGALGMVAGGGGGGGPGGGNGRPVAGGQANQGGGPQTIIVNVHGAISAGDHAKLGETIVKATEAGRRSGRVRDQQTITTRFE